MITRDFDGSDGDIIPPVFNGVGQFASVYYNASSVQYQKQVVITEDADTDLPEFLDNVGHRMFGIEDLQTSDKKDKVSISYALADRPGIASAANGTDKFFLQIDLNDGNDFLSIGDDLPLVPRASKNWGATVDGDDGNDTIEGGKLRDQLGGDEGADLIRGNGGDDIIGGGNGNDRLYGGDGNDFITCDSFTPGGRDIVYGGKGADTVYLSNDDVYDLIVLQSLSDSPKVDLHDTYFSFEAGTDEIDLSAIDASTKAARDQKFVVVKALTGKAGELAYKVTGADTSFPRWDFVGDVNGDKKGDLFFTVYQPSIDPGTKIADWFVL